MTYQDLVHMYGANKKFYVSDILFTDNQIRDRFTFPLSLIQTNKSYIVCDQDFVDPLEHFKPITG
jgi:hypothetical protein